LLVDGRREAAHLPVELGRVGRPGGAHVGAREAKLETPEPAQEDEAVTGIEGLLVALALLILPFFILAVLVRILPTRRLEEPSSGSA